jgi:hypothetical protein
MLQSLDKTLLIILFMSHVTYVVPWRLYNEMLNELMSNLRASCIGETKHRISLSVLFSPSKYKVIISSQFDEHR